MCDRGVKRLRQEGEEAEEAEHPPLLKCCKYVEDCSTAHKAWILLTGRGVKQNNNAGFTLVEVCARLGCHHCQGVLAWCFRWGSGCRADNARSLELARESSGKGSKYGHFQLGRLCFWGEGVVARDDAQALALYRLAAAQKFDEAQYSLGFMYERGHGVAADATEAMRWYQLAAAQGHPIALYWVANCHEHGLGVPKNKEEAIRLYRLAHAANHPCAWFKLL